MEGINYVKVEEIPLRISELLYQWKIEDTKKRMESRLENELYVTDLISCPLKLRYSKLYKELALASAFKPVALMGELLHLGLEKLLSELLGVDNVKTEVEYEREVVVDGTTYIVKGRVDAIVGDVLIEIKSVRSDTHIPLQHHVMQVRIYLWLTGLPKGILVYITPDRIAEFLIDTPASDGEVTDLVRSTIEGRPAPRYPWECSYCIYSQLCPSKTR